MSKLENYKGSVDLISGLRAKNSGVFPLMEAHDIQVDENGKRLDEALDGKVEKIGLPSPLAADTYVYAQTQSGTNLAPVGENPYAGRLVRFRSIATNAALNPNFTGTVLVATPRYDAQAVNKYYVDDTFVSKEMAELEYSRKLYEHTVDLDFAYYKRPVDSGIIYTFHPRIKIITTDSSLGYEAIASSFTVGDLSRLLIDYFKKEENDSRVLVPALNQSTGLYDYSFSTGIGDGYNLTVKGVVDENGDKISLYIESIELVTAHFYVKEL